MVHRGSQVAVATTSQPWPWAGVRVQRGVAAGTRKEDDKGEVRQARRERRAIRSEDHD